MVRGVLSVSIPGGTSEPTDEAAWYCWHASRKQALLESVWEKHGAFVHQQIIWLKDRPILTRSWYMWQHEPCFFGWRNRRVAVQVVSLAQTHRKRRHFAGGFVLWQMGGLLE